MTAPRVDMKGKRVMITGFTAGIGEAAAMALAEMGAELILVCRNEAKGESTLARIRERVPDVQLEMLVGDLGRHSDIRRIADQFLAGGRPLDVLFNNAGVVMLKRTLTDDGLEATFAVNHIGYFLLTRLLLEPLRADGGGRVVSTSSNAHTFGGGAMRFDDLQGEKKYTTFGAYGQSKLANILFTRELARRERENGVTANCFHPGFVGSDFAKNNGAFARIVMTVCKPFARSPEKGAETGVFLCTAPSLSDATGGYYFNMKSRRPARYAESDEDARRLWEISEELAGIAD
jgi:retinol dehydrogenase-12